MVFIDTNVLMYAVGGEHPLRGEARAFLENALEAQTRLVTSAQVLQELFHAYLPVGRTATLDAAMTLVEACVDEVWPVEGEDVWLARILADEHPALGARDLVHLACCLRREAEDLQTFDRGLSAAWSGG